MKKLIATGIIVLAAACISDTAEAQTENTQTTTDPSTATPVTTDQSTTTTDQSAVPAVTDSTAVVSTDSTGAVISPDSLTLPPDKPSSRLRTYSGKHRGNNVIYNPK